MPKLLTKTVFFINPDNLILLIVYVYDIPNKDSMHLKGDNNL